MSKIQVWVDFSRFILLRSLLFLLVLANMAILLLFLVINLSVFTGCQNPSNLVFIEFYVLCSAFFVECCARTNVHLS